MERTYAVIADGIVTALHLYAPGNQPDDLPDATGLDVAIGATWDGETFTPPPVPEISLEDRRAAMVASPAQIKVTLYDLGLLATVQAIVDADPRAGIIWAEALEIRRTNPLVEGLGAGGFTPSQIDDIFAYAQSLVI
jgi:hypothetical protein